MKFKKVPGLVTVFVPRNRIRTVRKLRSAYDRAETFGRSKASPGDKVEIQFVGGAA